VNIYLASVYAYSCISITIFLSNI